MWFLSYLYTVIYCLAYDEPLLYPWMETHLMVIYGVFMCCWIHFVRLCSSGKLECSFSFFLSLSGFGWSRRANSTECIWYILFLSVLWGTFKSLLFVLFRRKPQSHLLWAFLFEEPFLLLSHFLSRHLLALSSWVVLYVIYVSHPSPQRLFCEESSPYMVPGWFRCLQLAFLCVFSLFNSLLLSVSKGVVKSPKPCGYKEWFIGDQTAKILQRRTKCWESRFYVTVSRVGPLF